MQSVTIPVSDVEVAEQPLETLDLRMSLESMLQRRLEAAAVSDERLVICKDTHPFAQAANDAFYDHYPLSISPDDIWFCIAQGFATHVNMNAESLRHRFVRHQDKLVLAVENRDIILGKPSPWPDAFSAFSEQISRHVGRELRDTIVADFTTTNEFHRAATEIALMDSFQAYFEYELACGCGIPSIRVSGAPDDWRNIRKRAASLVQYGLDSWIGALLPVLDQLESTSRGFSDGEFWKSFFRYRSGSFGSAMTGWINVLFPFLRNDLGVLTPNPYVKTWPDEYRNALATESHEDWRERDAFDGPYLGQIPSGLCSAPVRVTDLRNGERHDMRFVAGMFGVSQDPATLCLSPSFGWAVTYDTKSPQTSG